MLVAHGLVREDNGQLVLDDRPGFTAALKQFKSQRVTLTVEEWHGTRSAKANRRYWGRIVPAVQAHLSRGRDVPLSKEQTHYVLKAGFRGCVEVNGLLIPKDTHNMPSPEFAEYCDSIEGHYAAEGVEFPEEY